MRVLFEKFYSFRVLRVAFAVLFLCMIGFGIIMGDALDGKTGFFGMQTTFSAARMEVILSEWGKQGLIAYMNTMYIDFIFPIAYAVALASGVALISTPKEKAAAPTKYALLFFTLPFAACICDMIENGFHLIMLPHPQSLNPMLSFLAASAASIKYLLLLASFMAIIVFAYRRMRVRNKSVQE